MKPENLETLLYYYMRERRSYDDVDSPVARETESYLPGGYDEPISPFHFPGSNYGNASYPADSDTPPSPMIQFGAGIFPEQSGPLADLLLSDHPSPAIIPSPPQSPLSGAQEIQVAEVGRKLAELTKRFSINQPDRSAVRFKQTCIFVPSENHSVSIPILRSPGCDDAPLTIKWKTSDKTAISGTHYVETQGEMSFEKDEKQKEIQVEILSSKVDADLRFQIELVVENSFFDPKSMTINIQNIKNYRPEENRIVENLLDESPTSPFDVLFILGDKLNKRMFYTGLTYFCSKADSLPVEMGLAMEFSRLCLEGKCLRYESVVSTLKEFFHSVELPDEF